MKADHSYAPFKLQRSDMSLTSESKKTVLSPHRGGMVFGAGHAALMEIERHNGRIASQLDKFYFEVMRCYIEAIQCPLPMHRTISRS